MSSTLSAHSPKFQSKLVTLDQIRTIPEPMALGSRHKPVHHARLIDTLLAEIAKRGMTVTREQYALARNQAALFGVLDFASLKTGRGLSFGFRSSTDQLMAISGVAGTRVFVCDNMTMSGDMIAFRRKSTSGLDLTEVVGVGFDKFVEQAQVLDLQIEILELTAISDMDAKNRIFDVFNAGVLPLHLFTDVSRYYFKPSDEMTDCQPRTLWGLHNAMTRAARDLSPVRLFRASLELGRAFQIHTDLDGDADDTIDGDVIDVESAMAKTVKRGGRSQTALPADMIRLANKLASLQRRYRDRMRVVRELQGEIKQTKREIKALAQSMEREADPFDQLPPFRTLGES